MRELNWAPIGDGSAGRQLFERFGRTAATLEIAPLGDTKYNGLQTTQAGAEPLRTGLAQGDARLSPLVFFNGYNSPAVDELETVLGPGVVRARCPCRRQRRPRHPSRSARAPVATIWMTGALSIREPNVLASVPRTSSG